MGACYEFGRGVPVDHAQAAAWYRLAARHGSLVAIYSLGALHAQDRIPRDDIEGLALLLEASERAKRGDPAADFVLEHEPPLAKRLMDRMPPADVAKARQRAALRSRTAVPTEESD